ncbi:MAG TPA: DJ-1/PfpI family protein [Steroidobacteraceae bacterium]|nr:DJ-1/PfpI family protein [Steroidobacteraceae bacterium]
MANATRRIVVLAAPGSQILDVVGPAQIFVRAAEHHATRAPEAAPAYRVEVVSANSESVVSTNGGFRLVADNPLHRTTGAIDTLLVAGGSAVEADEVSAAAVDWVRQQARSVRRIGSVCTGALLLARAGVLDGRNATTHWKWCGHLARNYPTIQVDPYPIFVRDGHVYTSAGVTAGMDLALALVEEDFGARLALEVARDLVLYLRRPGSQAQFSAALAMQYTDRRPLRDLETWVLENLRKTLSVETLAARVAMSPRNLTRVFSRELDMSPAKFVERLRVEAARRRLEESEVSLDRVAGECGFRNAATLRSVFRRTLQTTPGEYRERFGRSARRRDGVRP